MQEVVESPCLVGGEGSRTDPAPSDLLIALEGLGHLDVTNRRDAAVAGHPGEQADVTVADGALAACGGLANGEVALFVAGQEVWKASPGERFRHLSVGVGGKTVTILMSTDWTPVPSVQQLEDLFRLGQRIIDSVDFSIAP